MADYGTQLTGFATGGKSVEHRRVRGGLDSVRSPDKGSIQRGGLHRGLAFTRDLFTSGLLCTNQPSFHSPPPPALPTLVQYYCRANSELTRESERVRERESCMADFSTKLTGTATGSRVSST